MISNFERDGLRLYARACAAAPPASKTLAAWLVKVVCDGPGWPDVRLREWVPALGVKGLALMAELVEQRRVTADPQSWTGQWAVRHLREQLAEVSGDVDRHVRYWLSIWKVPSRTAESCRSSKAQVGQPRRSSGQDEV